MKKSPEELGKIFELVVTQSEEILMNIIPLETKLRSIYTIHTETMKNTIDNNEMIVYLNKIETPARFFKLKSIKYKNLIDKLNDMQSKRDELENRNQVILPKKENKIYDLINFFPVKIIPLREKYAIFQELLEEGGKIDDIFTNLNTITNSRKNRRIKKEFWRKSLHVTKYITKYVEDLAEHLYSAYYITDEISFKKELAEFDIKIRELDDFEDIVSYINDFMSSDEIISKQEIFEFYNNMTDKVKLVDKIMKLISSQTYIDHLILGLKDELIRISDEKKSILLEIANIDEPLKKLKEYLDSGKYLLDIFWKNILLEFDSFDQTLKNLLLFPEFNDWEDIRKKYALLCKIKVSVQSINSVFNVLMNSFDTGIINYKKAKRSYHRYGTDSSKRGLDVSTMQDVEISDASNKMLWQFIKLNNNLKNMDTYISDVDIFYKENNELVTDLYINIKKTLKEWGDIFKKLYTR